MLTTTSTKSRTVKSRLGGATKTEPTEEKMTTTTTMTMSDLPTMTAECESEELEQSHDEAESAAAVAALLEGGIGDDKLERSSFVLGEKKDRVVTIEGGVVSITSTYDACKFAVLMTNRWANFVNYCEQINKEAKELNHKT